MESKNTIVGDYIDIINDISWRSDSITGEIQTCFLGNKRLSRTPSKILFELYLNLNEEISKDSLCGTVYALKNVKSRRSMDVQIITIKDFLEGSNFQIISAKHNVIKLCLRG